MQSIDDLKASHDKALAKAIAEHALAALCPVTPKRTQLTTAPLGHWVLYDVRTLWGALDLMAKFEPLAFYKYKGTYTRFVPEALNVGRDAGEQTDGPYFFKIDVSQGEGFGPSVSFRWYAMVGADICEIHADLPYDFGGAYRAPFQATSNGRGQCLEGRRYINGEWRANTKLSSMTDSNVKWGSGDERSARFSYQVMADSLADDGLRVDIVDGLLRLENLAEALHGPRPVTEEGK